MRKSIGDVGPRRLACDKRWSVGCAEYTYRDTKLGVARFGDDWRAAGAAKPSVKAGRRLVEAHELLALQLFQILDADARRGCEMRRPRCFRDFEQWQFNTSISDPIISNSTPPHTQVRRTFAAVAPLYPDPPQLER